MTVKEDNTPEVNPFGRYGKTAIFAPLIIGGAVVAATIVMWQTHNRNEQAVEMSRIEERARDELRLAYGEMRALRPEKALERAAEADRLVKSLNSKLAPDYASLKISLLLVEAETLFMKDCAAHSDQAEEKFSQALALMPFASGEMWTFGMLGRARARFEQGKYGEALSDLDSVMGRNPSYGSAYYWRSLTRERLGDEAGAREDEQRARALDSWPPLRDFMQASCVWTRDIIHKPKADQPAHPAGASTAGEVEEKSLAPFFIPGPEELPDDDFDDFDDFDFDDVPDSRGGEYLDDANSSGF